MFKDSLRCVARNANGLSSTDGFLSVVRTNQYRGVCSGCRRRRIDLKDNIAADKVECGDENASLYFLSICQSVRVLVVITVKDTVVKMAVKG